LWGAQGKIREGATMNEDAELEVLEEESQVEDAEVIETEDEPTEPSDSSTENEEPEKNRVQERIDELTKARREAEREKEYWREMAMKSEKSEQTPVKAPEPVEVKTLEDFDFDERAYTSYIFEQARNEAVQAAKHALQEDNTSREAQTRQREFQAKEKEYAKEMPDYMQVTRDTSLPLTKEMVDIASSSDQGPAILYHLAKNPDISEMIAGLPPLIAAREMGKIEAKLSKEAKSTSKAPPPPPKIKGVDAGLKVAPDDPSSDKLSTEKWLEARNKQIYK